MSRMLPESPATCGWEMSSLHIPNISSKSSISNTFLLSWMSLTSPKNNLASTIILSPSKTLKSVAIILSNCMVSQGNLFMMLYQKEKPFWFIVKKVITDRHLLLLHICFNTKVWIMKPLSNIFTNDDHVPWFGKHA